MKCFVIFSLMTTVTQKKRASTSKTDLSISITFQAVTVLVRNVKYFKLEADELKTLLLYAEEDCQNDERQTNSFSLLKSILEARLVSNELHEVMEKVSRICILSESAKSR